MSTNFKQKQYNTKTRYKGYYIDIREGERVGIQWTYSFDEEGNITNEKEEYVTKLK